MEVEAGKMQDLLILNAQKIKRKHGCIESTSVVSVGNVIRVRQAPESL